MQVFTVHCRSENSASLSGLAEDAIFVKEGFSWPAFLIPAIWLIYKRMWWVLLAFVLLQLLITIAAGLVGLDGMTIFLCSLSINLLLGFEGNELYRWSLSRRRYRTSEIVTGADLSGAEHSFYSGKLGIGSSLTTGIAG